MKNTQSHSKEINSSNFSLETEFINKSWSKSIHLIHYVGYGILLLMFFDLAEIFYPLNFFNSVWEFEVFVRLVEKAIIPLIGLVLVFYSGLNFRRKWERYLLPLLSWISIFVAIFYILFIPLTIVNTIRIDKDNNVAIVNQQEVKLNEIRQIEELLSTITTEVEMKDYLSYFNNLSSDITESTQLDETKEKLANMLKLEKQNIIAQAQKTYIQKRQILAKNSIKWNLGALVSGVLFVLLWQGTSWARG